jgi:hypothetical protein
MQGAKGAPDRKPYSFLSALLAVVCACLYFGCAGYNPYRSPWDNLFSPPRYYPHYSTARHRRGERRRVAHNRSPGGEPTTTNASESVPPDTGRAPAPAAAAAPAASAASEPPASLSLVGDGGDRARAQRLLKTVDTKLGRARAHGLKGSQKETYERASQLAHRAHRALADDDSAAASSLATKASSLAADIAEP